MTDEFFNEVTVSFEEATHFALLTVVEVDFKATLVAFTCLRGWNDFFSFKKIAFVFGARKEFWDVCFIEITVQNDTVVLDFLIPGVRETMGQVSVVGYDE